MPTFPYGQQGEIEMKPFVNTGSLPAQQQQLLLTDVGSVLNSQTTKALDQLKMSHSTAIDLATKKSQYKLKLLESEYRLKEKALQNKHFGGVVKLKEGETKQDLIKAYEADLRDLEYDFQIASARATAKDQPNVDMLNSELQQRQQKIQQNFIQKQISLQTIQALQDKGTITLEASLQEQWGLAGYDLPLSAFKAGPATPEDELRGISGLIRTLEGEGLKDYFGIEGGAELFMQSRRQLALLKQRRSELLAPMLERFLPKSVSLAKAAQRATGVNQPSTLAGKISVEKEKQQPSGKPIYQRSRQTGQVRVSYDGGRTWRVQ